MPLLELHRLFSLTIGFSCHILYLNTGKKTMLFRREAKFPRRITLHGAEVAQKIGQGFTKIVQGGGDPQTAQWQAT
jgi:hypothetical protein